MISPRRQVDMRTLAGWMGVGLSVAMACFWAFWGSMENFHEGWFNPDLGRNLALMFAQYLSPMILFILLGAASISYPRLGAAAHLLFGMFLSIIFRNVGVVMVFGVPLLLVAVLYWFGRVEPKRIAYWLMVGLPLVTAIGFSVGPGWRTFTRIDDGYRGARLIDGNGVRLVWAPSGPGWPSNGVSWFDAVTAAERLSFDGLTVVDTPTHIWRLPTLDEVVRSAARHGLNAGGTLDSTGLQPTYTVWPDKETPLWDQHSMIIYWWTATEKDSAQAYLTSYNGGLFPQNKKVGLGYYGFRAVRDPIPADSILPNAVRLNSK
jgi:hypothetical protein